MMIVTRSGSLGPSQHPATRLGWLALGLAGLLTTPSAHPQTTLQADGPGNTYELINSVLGGTAEEVPDCSHPAFGRHIAELFDSDLGKYVFVFYLHVTPDNDRCINFDRQRNEIKTYGPSPAYLKGMYGDLCSYRWKFKLDAGFQPSPNFTHIHQIKAGDGTDSDSPIITITPRYASPNRLELIYTAPTGLSGSATFTTSPLSNYTGQWIEAYERALYASNGTYQLTLRRVSDGGVLLSYTNNNLNMWRGDNTFNRPKWGIYRSLNSSNYLRDEAVLFADFCLAKGTDVCPSDVGTPPLFTLAATPALQAVNAGGSTSYTVTLATNTGFSGTASFAVTGLPANASAAFNPGSLSGAGSSTLSLTTSTNTPPGTNSLTIRGTIPGLATNTAIVSLVVTAPGSALVWNSASSAAWDTTTPNWFDAQTGSNGVFLPGNNVVFADRVGVVTNATIAPGVAVLPASVTVSAALNNYTISGAGKISGAGSLLKSGNSVLTLNTTNDYTGVTTLSGGVVAVALLANGGAASGIGAASAGPTNIVLDGGGLRWTGGSSLSVDRGFSITANGGTLDASPPTQFNLTLAGPLVMSGAGSRTLTLAGTDPNPLTIGGNVISSAISNGVGGLTTLVKYGNNAWNLTASNTYSGGTIINAGRVRANSSPAALGVGPVTVAGGAQAYLNVAGTYRNAFFLEGLGIPETDGNFGALRLAANGVLVTNTITLTGPARITARGATAAGVLTLSNSANAWSGDTTISHGTVKLGAPNAIPHGIERGNVLLNNSNPTNDSVLDLAGISATINGLGSSGPDLSRCVVTNSSTTAATLTLGDNDANGVFGGSIRNGTGAISLTKLGQGAQALAGVSSFTGPTLVNAGVLSGNGSLAGPLTVNPGGTLSPGDSIGTFSVSNSATLLGTTAMDLDRAAQTNDLLRCTGSLAFGGTLSLSNLSGTLAANDSFKLFDAASYSGSFARLSPAIPALNLGWDTTTLAHDGTLRIINAPTPPPKITASRFDGSNLILGGTNGVPGWPYYVLASTNLALPLSDWTRVQTNRFDSTGSFNLTNALSTQPRQFYLLQLSGP